MTSTVPGPSIYDLVSEVQHRGVDETNLSADLSMELGLDAFSMPMDPLAAMLDTTMSFDWVCFVELKTRTTSGADYWQDDFDNHVRQPNVDYQAWPDLSFQDFNFEEDNNYNI